MNRLLLVGICVLQSLSGPLFCQILQDHPELCGDRTRPEPVPDGIVVTINKANAVDTNLHYGGGRLIKLQGINDEIYEVCSLPSNRFVFFGISHAGYTVNIFDVSHQSIVEFPSFDPMMSPDRRWLASRHFTAPQSQVQTSEEYLLYDLADSAESNRHAANPATIDAEGWTMYPAFPNSAPVDLADIPQANLHEWRSKSFFWASDSHSLVFADKVADQLSLVLVLIVNDKPQAYTHLVSAAEVCGETGSTNGLTLKDASISPVPTASLNVLASFEDAVDSGCNLQQLNLYREDFVPAKVEVYEHRKLKQSTGVPYKPLDN